MGSRGTVIQFADGTSIILTAAKDDDLSKKIEETLGRLSEWFGPNKLHLNREKTVIITFNARGSQAVSSSPAIQVSDVAKFLGLTINHNLTWEDHVSALSKK
jgi:homoserine acetyltransferase